VQGQDALATAPPQGVVETMKTISLRLPESVLESLKALARKRDVPYQSHSENSLRGRDFVILRREPKDLATE
jgi:hypothetical protein